MNKRNRNLIAMLCVMLLLVIALCACMTKDKQKDEPTAVPSTTPATTDPGYGVDNWEDISGTEGGSGNQQPTQNETIEEPSQSTQPAETDSTQATTAPNPYTPGSLSYEEYLALDGEQQQLYALSFDSVEAYVNWYNSALEEYENGEVIEITGPVDLGGIAGNS